MTEYHVLQRKCSIEADVCWEIGIHWLIGSNKWRLTAVQSLCNWANLLKKVSPTRIRDVSLLKYWNPLDWGAFLSRIEGDKEDMSHRLVSWRLSLVAIIYTLSSDSTFRCSGVHNLTQKAESGVGFSPHIMPCFRL